MVFQGENRGIVSSTPLKLKILKTKILPTWGGLHRLYDFTDAMEWER
jgi:hypothetical protein